MNVMLRARAPVFHGKCGDCQLARSSVYGFAFAPIKFRNVGKAGSFQQVARAPRCDYTRSLIKTMECSQIEVIKVRMRQKDHIDVRQLTNMERRRSQAFRAYGDTR